MSQVRYTNFVSVSITPEAREALREMADWMPNRLGKKVSLSEVILINRQLANRYGEGRQIEECAREVGAL